MGWDERVWGRGTGKGTGQNFRERGSSFACGTALMFTFTFSTGCWLWLLNV